MGVDAEVEETVNSKNYRQSGDSYLKTEMLSDVAPRASYFSNSFSSVVFQSSLNCCLGGKWESIGDTEAKRSGLLSCSMIF